MGFHFFWWHCTLIVPSKSQWDTRSSTEFCVYTAKLMMTTSVVMEEGYFIYLVLLTQQLLHPHFLMLPLWWGNVMFLAISSSIALVPSSTIFNWLGSNFSNHWIYATSSDPSCTCQWLYWCSKMHLVCTATVSILWRPPLAVHQPAWQLPHMQHCVHLDWMAAVISGLSVVHCHCCATTWSNSELLPGSPAHCALTNDLLPVPWSLDACLASNLVPQFLLTSDPPLVFMLLLARRPCTFISTFQSHRMCLHDPSWTFMQVGITALIHWTIMVSGYFSFIPNAWTLSVYWSKELSSCVARWNHAHDHPSQPPPSGSLS